MDFDPISDKPRNLARSRRMFTRMKAGDIAFVICLLHLLAVATWSASSLI